jgi:hypothetical protein
MVMVVPGGQKTVFLTLFFFFGAWSLAYGDAAEGTGVYYAGDVALEVEHA